VFERYRKEQREEGEEPWAPFENAEEWSLAQWLVKNLGQTQTDEYLKLPIVNELPHGPAWSCNMVTVRGNREDENGELLEEEVELW
ncbi:hypothetical protein DFH29DRAFT_779952, partial [Suillus ampliporus]